MDSAIALTIEAGGERRSATVTSLSVSPRYARVVLETGAELGGEHDVAIVLDQHAIRLRVIEARANADATVIVAELDTTAEQRRALATLARVVDFGDTDSFEIHSGGRFERTTTRAPRVRSPDELLADVLANPDDDSPRLVYADALSQRDDPRGEFIIVQCELARCEVEGGHPKWKIAELRARETELLARHKKKWVGDFAGTRTEYGFGGDRTYVKGTPTKWHFVRGFVDRVEMQVPDFVRNAPALFAREPVRSLHPTNGSLSQLVVECGELHRLRELDLTPGKLRGDDARALAADTKMTSLRLLSLANCKLGPRAMRDFERHGVEKPALRNLDLSSNALGDNGAAALARSPILRTLTVLSLGANNIGDAGVLALVASLHLDHLEQLRLGPRELGAAARSALRERFGERVRIS
jgi:uncharacterized protein (TIGR02996 family)